MSQASRQFHSKGIIEQSMNVLSTAAYDRKAVINSICDLVAQRNNLMQLSKRPEFPDYSTLRKWLCEDEQLSAQYARARQARADARADYIDQINEMLLAGQIDAQTARVMIDSEKWQAGKEHSKRYGERLEVNHGGNLNLTAMTDSELIRIAQEQAQPLMIEAEIVTDDKSS
jgi:hypothetical protein